MSYLENLQQLRVEAMNTRKLEYKNILESCRKNEYPAYKKALEKQIADFPHKDIYSIHVQDKNILMAIKDCFESDGLKCLYQRELCLIHIQVPQTFEEL